MIRGRLIRVAFWSFAMLVLLAAAAFLWRRQSPWPGITPFLESHRVKSFRDIGREVPARTVQRGETVRALDRSPQPLPETYAFGARHRSLVVFLDRTETTGLLVAHRGAITYEEYELAEYPANRLWGPRRVQAGVPTEREVTSRGRLRVSNAHAPPGSKPSRNHMQHVPPATRPKTMSVASSILPVAGKRVAP